MIPGFGLSTITVPSFSALNHKFPARYIGVVINTLTTATNMGPIFLVMIYNYFFLKDGSYDKQDIRGYFLFLCVFFLVANILAILVYKCRVSQECEKCSDSMELLSTDFQDDCNPETPILETDEATRIKRTGKGALLYSDSLDDFGIKHEYTLKEVLQSPRFHLTVWPAGILLALKFVGVSNISTLLHAYGLQRYEATAPFIQPAGSVMFKPLLGYLSDCTKERFSRAWYLAVAAIVHICCFIVAIFALNNFVVFCVVNIGWAVASDTAYIQPGVFSDIFGKKYFGLNMSFLMCIDAFFMFIPQTWFSAIYDNHAGPDGLCYGNQCFTLSLILGAVVALLCGLTLGYYLYLETTQKDTNA